MSDSVFDLIIRQVAMDAEAMRDEVALLRQAVAEVARDVRSLTHVIASKAPSVRQQYEMAALQAIMSATAGQRQAFSPQQVRADAILMADLMLPSGAFDEREEER